MDRDSIAIPVELTAFSPIFFFEFLLGLPATAILLALVIKSRTKLTNSSIYLASLSIASLVQLLTAIPLLVNLLARRCITGNSVFSLASGVMIGGPLVSLSCHFLLSRDKYHAVKHPSQRDWIKSNKAYIYTATVWAASLLAAVFGIGLNLRERTRIGTNGTEFGCFLSDSTPREFPQEIAQFGGTVIITIVDLVLILLTSAYHFLLFRELKSVRHIEGYYNTSWPPRKVVVNCNKLPGATNELHTARSLLIIFMIQVLASIVTSTHRLVNLAQGATSSIDFATTGHAIAILGVLFVYYIPTLNPAILIISNSRYRRRVIRLLKCRYTAESDDAQHLLKTSSRQITRPPAVSTEDNSLSRSSSLTKVTTADEDSIHTSTLTINLLPIHHHYQCWENSS